MKVLIIAHKPPFPAIDGGCVASSKVIESLEKQGFDYRLAVIHTPKHPFNPDAFPSAIRKKIVAESFINTTGVWNFIKKLSDWRSSVFVQKFYDKKFEQKLKDFCGTYKPDIVHFESLFTSAYFLPLRKKMPQLKFVLRTHNLEHQLWAQRAASSGFLKRMILQLPVRKLKNWEDYVMRQMDGVAAIAEGEVTYLKKLSPGVPCIHLPTGVQINAQESTLASSFFHIAAMDWGPNKRALNWFLKKVWSPTELPEKAVLHLAGKGLKKYDYKDVKAIHNHGMVANSRSFICAHGIMLVPLFEGSGLRIKIIEAGALGVPIIATKKAIEGLALVQGEQVLLA